MVARRLYVGVFVCEFQVVIDQTPHLTFENVKSEYRSQADLEMVGSECLVHRHIRLL